MSIGKCFHRIRAVACIGVIGWGQGSSTSFSGVLNGNSFANFFTVEWTHLASQGRSYNSLNEVKSQMVFSFHPIFKNLLY